MFSGTIRVKELESTTNVQQHFVISQRSGKLNPTIYHAYGVEGIYRYPGGTIICAVTVCGRVFTHYKKLTERPEGRQFHVCDYCAGLVDFNNLAADLKQFVQQQNTINANAAAEKEQLREFALRRFAAKFNLPATTLENGVLVTQFKGDRFTIRLESNA